MLAWLAVAAWGPSTPLRRAARHLHWDLMDGEIGEREREGEKDRDIEDGDKDGEGEFQLLASEN